MKDKNYKVILIIDKEEQMEEAKTEFNYILQAMKITTNDDFKKVIECLDNIEDKYKLVDNNTVQYHFKSKSIIMDMSSKVNNNRYILTIKCNSYNLKENESEMTLDTVDKPLIGFFDVKDIEKNVSEAIDNDVFKSIIIDSDKFNIQLYDRRYI